ncbi:MAG: arginase [Defluviitaleaceae bacterium]|nr:arginase [Defluviitaleaceae bacterium]MCL2836989.1 arginase [Defluviitaleaceae bacterium]
MEVVVLGVPFGDGAGVAGCGEAPRVLREMGLLDRIGKHRIVRDKGDVAVPDADPGNENKSENLNNEKIFNYKRVIDFNRVVANMAIKYADNEDFTLFLGGDHSISAGSIAGRLSFFPDTAVIWMDAHADLNTDETSPSKNAHGMPVAALMRLGEEKPHSILPNVQLPIKNLFMLGQRGKALDKGEIDFINEHGIFIRTWDKMRSEGVVSVLESVFDNARKNGATRVHLSFDIDVLCGGLAPATGTPVPDGPDVYYVKLMLRALAGSGLLRSMDFVEYNPSLDKDGASGKLCVELIEEVFKHLV